MKYTAGFIGAGNMGGALLKAVSEKIGGENTAVYDINKKSAQAAAEKNGAAFVTLEELVKESKYIFLGVKPNVIDSVCREIRAFIGGQSVIVSMAAGVCIGDLQNALRNDRIIRIMPNTPAAVGEGMILYSTGDGITEDSEFLNIMSGCGMIDKIDEKLIDAAAALSGCGPAFVYMFIEALADGAVCRGLPRAKAQLYAEQTVLGAAKLALSSGKHPGLLKDEVCSPGGTTIEGVLALENGAFRHAVASAVTAAFDKTAKLKK